TVAQDEGRDADELAAIVQNGPARASGIHRQIGLEEEHLLEGATDERDDAAVEREAHLPWRAHGVDLVAALDGLEAVEAVCRGRPGARGDLAIDGEERQIEVGIAFDDP